jgi:hypothetical protein
MRHPGALPAALQATPKPKIERDPSRKQKSRFV